MKHYLDPGNANSGGEAAPRRVVLLGASNLTKGIGTVLDTAYRTWGRPLELFGAFGHGRSFGRSSSLFSRQLPGILECGMWEELDRRPKLPTAGLVTDIGNDLLYEEPVEQIVDWVRECMDRLVALQARTVVTLLPVENLPKLSRARFHLMRSLFFPHSRITIEEVIRRAHQLNDAVKLLALERGFRVVPQRPAWYGLDPIHIRLRYRGQAWSEILSSWSATDIPSQPTRESMRQTLYLRSRFPDRRRVMGIEQRSPQPSARLRDGTSLAIY